jgi:hypothetical protein
MVFENEETTLRLRQPAQIAHITQEPVSQPQRATIVKANTPQNIEIVPMPEPQKAIITPQAQPASRIQLTPFQRALAHDMGRLFRRAPVNQEPVQAPAHAQEPQASPAPAVVAQPVPQEPMLQMPAPVVNTEEQEAIAELERLMNELKPWSLPPSQ